MARPLALALLALCVLLGPGALAQGPSAPRSLGELLAAAADQTPYTLGGSGAYGPSGLSSGFGNTFGTRRGSGFTGGQPASNNFGGYVASSGGYGWRNRRMLGERAAAAADASITAFGGRTAGFAPDRTPVTNTNGAMYFGSQGVDFMGGITTAFDNFGNPFMNQDGRGQIRGRKLGERANPTSISDAAPGSASAMGGAPLTFAQAQAMHAEMMAAAGEQNAWAAAMMAPPAPKPAAAAEPAAAALAGKPALPKPAPAPAAAAAAKAVASPATGTAQAAAAAPAAAGAMRVIQAPAVVIGNGITPMA
ncbi:hypothetical protein MNEG_12738 [Monoraphidium neglectum]|uniref:Uncharacterized protein n=1 Tax=Monoraphidium neglectum TaxID=145388 RepID=A0A0D2MJW2_9CHLO|nr:hypothetical protein MNEG_12738 [Monoraphidium neglectum]KIY95225.1 hypothetical protein MNEG_12738 [Monoraphidium neglectum]|eukprot:XP_013894245.1 hypothetical protein MNEG_12738 [Monoraphidium neglectum]